MAKKLLVIAACVVAAFGSETLGSNDRTSPRYRQPTDKTVKAKTLVATESVEHLDRLAREPMVVELSDGTLFVTGYGGQHDEVEKIPDLWRSRDHGATWETRECRPQRGRRDWQL